MVLGPNSYIARRKGKLVEGYRVAFPLGLIVICVDAGLSLEAALDRISGEISRQNNLMLMGAETRAGRSTIDALSSLGNRGWSPLYIAPHRKIVIGSKASFVSPFLRA